MWQNHACPSFTEVAHSYDEKKNLLKNVTSVLMSKRYDLSYCFYLCLLKRVLLCSPETTLSTPLGEVPPLLVVT